MDVLIFHRVIYSFTNVTGFRNNNTPEFGAINCLVDLGDGYCVCLMKS